MPTCRHSSFFSYNRLGYPLYFKLFFLCADQARNARMSLKPLATTVQDSLSVLDPAARRLHLSSGRHLDYDFLLLLVDRDKPVLHRGLLSLGKIVAQVFAPSVCVMLIPASWLSMLYRNKQFCVCVKVHVTSFVEPEMSSCRRWSPVQYLYSVTCQILFFLQNVSIADTLK